jgi:hypothetical protein
LRHAPGLEALPLERWLALLETPHPSALEVLCELMAARLDPKRLTFRQVAELARSRPLPVARLGFWWLQQRRPQTPDDCQALLELAEAEAEPLRAEMVRWARRQLSDSRLFEPGWVLELLDSRHLDVRTEGWAWFRDEPRVRDDVELWRKLLESPYDDVRLLLVAELEDRVGRGTGPGDEEELGPEQVRFLWATVLLNVHRGNRIKPLVVRQLVRRVNRRAAEAALLLPLLAVALRSVRGPEWRSGLVGVVQLVERNPDLAGPVRAAFPELSW